MKKYFLALVTALVIGCGTVPAPTNSLIQFGITIGMQYAIPNEATRTAVANWADTIAGGLRTVTGAPTSQELTAYLLTFIPADVRTKYPEIGTLVMPYVVSVYEAARQKYGADAAKLYPVLNQIATNIEVGVAPYISK